RRAHPAGQRAVVGDGDARGKSRHLLLLVLGGRVRGERRDEGVLRDLDGPDVLHALLALLLLLEQLALAADVTAVALGEHVLAHGADGLAGDDARTDRGLDRKSTRLNSSHVKSS